MHAGQHVFEWARQNGYTVAQMAKELGYPPHTLSQALQLNQITPRLALRTKEALLSPPIFPEASDDERPET